MDSLLLERPLFYGQPIDVKKTRQIPNDLQISISKSRQLKPLFVTKCDTSTSRDSVCIVLRNDPIDKAAQIETSGPTFDLDQCPSAEIADYSFITPVFLHFASDFRAPRTGTRQTETFSFKMKDVQGLLRIVSTDRWIPGRWTSEGWILAQQEQEGWTWILIARDQVQGFILHHLMLINMQKQTGIAECARVLKLLVPLDKLDLLEEFRPRRRRLVLEECFFLLPNRWFQMRVAYMLIDAIINDYHQEGHAAAAYAVVRLKKTGEPFPVLSIDGWSKIAYRYPPLKIQLGRSRSATSTVF